MSWLNGFHLLCYVLTALLLLVLWKTKDYDAMFTFAAAAAMELSDMVRGVTAAIKAVADR